MRKTLAVVIMSIFTITIASTAPVTGTASSLSVVKDSPAPEPVCPPSICSVAN
jgi:hypothetical protein